MAQDTSFTEGCPKHWTTLQDEALKAAYPSMITHADISSFKRSICKTILQTPNTPSLMLTAVRDPLPNAANQFSYDLDFLTHRIKHLLPDNTITIKTPSLLTTWSKTLDDSENKNRICTKGCMSPRRPHPNLWVHISTHSLRCGGCGRKDIEPSPNDPIKTLTSTAWRLTYASTDEQKQQYNNPFPGRMPSSTPSPKTTTTTITTTTATEPNIPIPPLWSRPHDAHLHESYILQTTRPIFPIFSTINLKHAFSIFFPPSFTDLYIDTSVYDLCFVHGRLEFIFGPCVCRGGEVSGSRCRGRCYLFPFVKIEMSDSENVMTCGKCELGEKAVYGIPVAGGGGWKEMRCGGCGNEDIEVAGSR
ncbi:MAG: hypothetical protein LQ343_001051 [Gyalolechia ehrenbergii]|nr:MAG: hypothetical protein LQ343_001051 [Gyalolechia ehrenbergii]